MPAILKYLFNFMELRELFGIDAMVYAVLAILGTVLFFLRLGLGLLFGIGDELDFDADMGDGSDFGLISVLSVTSFVMGAGWMGLVAQIDWGLSDGMSAVLSVGFGFAMMVLSASLLFGMQRLSYEPTTDLTTAVGRTGTVYMTIPQGGSGKVRVEVQGQTMIKPARTTSGTIREFTDVTVTEIRDDGTFIVAPLEPAGVSPADQSAQSAQTSDPSTDSSTPLPDPPPASQA